MILLILAIIAIATATVLKIVFDMKKFLRNIASTPTVSTEITYIAPHGSTLLSISGDLAEPDETFDVFFELTSGYDINLYDSAGNKYEYWFPCIISKEHKHAYRIVTASPGKDLLTLTIIGRSQVIRRYLEIDFSEE
jgi:hypothetical protein